MAYKLYTNYWENELTGVRKRHGTYDSEDAAKEGIRAWWEIHGESYPDARTYRTNTGALEIKYGSDHYHYRIESHESDVPLVKADYKLKSQGEIQAQRAQLNLDEDLYLFDELAEPYRDRLIMAFNDVDQVRSRAYTKTGEPVGSLL